MVAGKEDEWRDWYYAIELPRAAMSVGSMGLPCTLRGCYAFWSQMSYFWFIPMVMELWFMEDDKFRSMHGRIMRSLCDISLVLFLVSSRAEPQCYVSRLQPDCRVATGRPGARIHHTVSRVAITSQEPDTNDFISRMYEKCFIEVSTESHAHSYQI